MYFMGKVKPISWVNTVAVTIFSASEPHLRQGVGNDGIAAFRRRTNRCAANRCAAPGSRRRDRLGKFFLASRPTGMPLFL
jgi:hypothetical protein